MLSSRDDGLANRDGRLAPHVRVVHFLFQSTLFFSILYRYVDALGLHFGPLTSDVRRELRIGRDVHGAVITGIDNGSPAASLGLARGDVVVSIANHPVHTPQDVKKGIADAKAQGRSAVLVLVSGQNGQRFVALKLGET